jgi:glycosyltransferase involved in cell wall biosynthesis
MKYPATALLVACYDPRGLSPIVDQITSWVKHSRFRIRVINLYKTFPQYGMRILDAQVVSDATAIIIHPTVCYSPNNLLDLCESLKKNGKHKSPLIVLYKQDEHVQSHVTAQIIGRYGIDIVLTCVSAQDRMKAYPAELVGNAFFEQVYTGYVSQQLLENAPQKPWREREIVFFYRGSKQPPEIGRLGFLKYALARRLINACKLRDLNFDASSEWTDRILGFDWLLALSNSRATVSLESGSNCFDFNGELKVAVDEFLKERPNIDPWSDNGFETLSDAVLGKYEDNIHYGQIAPRHIEAVITFTPQLLLPGDYSGIFQASRHYIELKPDFSNFDDAVELLNDNDYRSQMLQCAYEEIAMNPRLQFNKFVGRVDDLIEGHQPTLFGLDKNFEHTAYKKTKPNSGRLQVVLLCPHRAHLDPRITWWSQHTSEQWDVHVVEVDKRVNKLGGKENAGEILLSARETNIGIHDLPDEVIDGGSVSFVIEMLCRVSEQLKRWGSCEEWSGLYSADHVWLMDHFVRISVGLIEAGVRIRGCDLLIAVDLPALPAGLYLSELYEVPLIYDAHEIWSHCSLNLEWDEIEWWNQLERNLIQNVDIPVTVSSGIGQWYQREMKTEMVVVPNFSPVPDSARQSHLRPVVDSVRFLFLGNFAEQRGIEQLIQAWEFDPDIATLTLQGPRSEHRDKCERLAKSLDRSERGVRFAPPVSEDELISEAVQYHVGIIPYIYTYPYSHCCPNKLSQYMAAGCAILSNHLPFIEQCIFDANCGVSVNFNSPQRIQKKIREIVDDKGKIEIWRANALKAFESRFNWKIASKAVLERVRALEISSNTGYGITLFPPNEVIQKAKTFCSQSEGNHKSINENNYSRLVRFIEPRLRVAPSVYKFARGGSRTIRKLFRIK